MPGDQAGHAGPAEGVGSWGGGCAACRARAQPVSLLWSDLWLPGSLLCWLVWGLDQLPVPTAPATAAGLSPLHRRAK